MDIRFLLCESKVPKVTSSLPLPSTAVTQSSHEWTHPERPYVASSPAPANAHSPSCASHLTQGLTATPNEALLATSSPSFPSHSIATAYTNSKRSILESLRPYVRPEAHLDEACLDQLVQDGLYQHIWSEINHALLRYTTPGSKSYHELQNRITVSPDARNIHVQSYDSKFQWSTLRGQKPSQQAFDDTVSHLLEQHCYNLAIELASQSTNVLNWLRKKDTESKESQQEGGSMQTIQDQYKDLAGLHKSVVDFSTLVHRRCEREKARVEQTKARQKLTCECTVSGCSKRIEGRNRISLATKHMRQTHGVHGRLYYCTFVNCRRRVFTTWTEYTQHLRVCHQ